MPVEAGLARSAAGPDPRHCRPAHRRV